MKIEDRPVVQSRKRISRGMLLLSIILVVSCITGSVVSIILYQKYSADYRSYMSLGQEGIRHLQTAEALVAAYPQNPLDAHAVRTMRNEFTAASTAFVKLRNGLQSLPGIITLVPTYGSRLQAVLHLVPLAINISQAGVAGSDILGFLITKFHDPLNGSTHGLNMADFSAIIQYFQRIRTIFQSTVEQIHSLSPSDLQFDPRFNRIFINFRNEIPKFQTWLDDVGTFLSVAPDLLGINAPANYLIEVLDSTELRPGGGFIGNYGIATLSGARLVDAPITDVALLDLPYETQGHSIPFPPQYRWFDLAPQGWSFRDSNLDADFPTAARDGEKNYQIEGGKVPIQGVIAITPALIQHALEITGPIAVPEYNETITAQNLIGRIHYHQLALTAEGGQSDTAPAPDKHSSERKHFIALLGEHFLAHIHALPTTDVPVFLQMVIHALYTKDLQVYLNSDVTEGLLHLYRLDGAIQAPVGESLFVVDANISGNKASLFLANVLSDQVTLDEAGNALHHTTISYSWAVNGQPYGWTRYRDYVRVYAPPGSVLQLQRGWEPRGTSEAFGREVWAGYFTLLYGQTQTITLVWTLPHVAQQDAQGWHYQYVIQHQAGTQWTLHLSITLPLCAVVAQKSGGLVSKQGHSMTLTQSIDRDIYLSMDYTCR